MQKKLVTLCLSAAVAASAATIGDASAADVCISSQAQTAMSACLNAKIAPPSGKKRGPTFTSAPQGTAPKTKAPAPSPTAVNATTAKQIRRTPRRALAAAPRDRNPGPGEPVRATPKNAPDRPELMRRLAEGYVELESAAFRDKTEERIKADEAKRKNPKAVAGLQAEAARPERSSSAARGRPPSSTTRCSRPQYPKWCQTPTRPTRRRAPAAPTRSSTTSPTSTSRRSSSRTRARSTSSSSRTAPQSKYIPNAYLAFGELFFNEAQGDP